MERVISRRTLIVGTGAIVAVAALGKAFVEGQMLQSHSQSPIDFDFPIDPVTDQEREDQVNIARRFINAEYFRSQDPEVINVSPGGQRYYPGRGESAKYVERVIRGIIRTASGQNFSIANIYDHDNHAFLRASLGWEHIFRTNHPELREFFVPNRQIRKDQTGLIPEDTLEDLLRAAYNLPEGLSISVREYNIGWGSFGSGRQGRGQYKVKAVELSGKVDDSYFASMTQEEKPQ